jgi:hypothetical protein
VDLDKMLKLQTLGVENSRTTAEAASREIIQSQSRFDGLHK